MKKTEKAHMPILPASFITFITLITFIALACPASYAADFTREIEPEFPLERQTYLGMDHVGMLWFIVDYGIREDGTPFSVARRYFTNEEIRQEIIEILITRFDHSPEVAGNLYFTEFGYEYTQDGTQFTFTYIRHRDQLGNDIHSTFFDNSCENTMRTYSDIVHDHALGRALALALATAPQP